MLSPTVSVQPPEGPSTPEQSTRRRGLSYLRSLSSHSSAGGSDQLRPSPRHFFQRSSSYNNDSKSKSPTSGRRRSHSRPNEPTALSAERPALTRVLSAGNSPSLSPVTLENRSPEDTTHSTTATDSQAGTEVPTTISDNMARTVRPSTPRRVTDSVLSTHSENAQTATTNGARPPSSSMSNGTNNGPANLAPVKSEEEKTKPPMIRFFPHQDLRNNGRQSLNFSPVSRILPAENSIIRVGRYSEREGLPVANPKDPSDAPVGFKSKVVSRKHCEFSFTDGQWQIRDVGSSSGTFLNHIRLSQPNQESRPFPIKDGDIVQLGIDFKGGEEMIFRCVKIRIECNRSWQKKPNTFNKSRQAQLLGLSKDQPAADQNSGECSICLGSVRPCQSLFVAPCAHVWHYKCIRPMIEGRQGQYPSFQCPNCRAWADLEADVDVVEEDGESWIENGDNSDDHLEVDRADSPEVAMNGTGIEHETANGEASSADPAESSTTTQVKDALTPTMQSGGLLSRRAVAFSGTTEGSAANTIPMPARPTQEELGSQLTRQDTRTNSSNSDHVVAGEGPLTPRNNAGPFVFDGSGGTGDSHRRTLFVPGLFEVAENPHP